MPEMPEGYALRTASRDDFAAIAALIEVADTADYGRVTFTESDLDETWSFPNFSPESGTWLVTTGEGEVVAYGWMMPRLSAGKMTDAFALVHPDHRGRGIGSAIARLMEVRARERISATAPGPALFHQAIPGLADGARALFERLEYKVVRHFFRMETDLDPSAELPPDPWSRRRCTIIGATCR